MALPPLSSIASPAATSSTWPAATTPRREVAAVDGDVALTGSMQRRSPFPHAGERMQHPVGHASTRRRHRVALHALTPSLSRSAGEGALGRRRAILSPLPLAGEGRVRVRRTTRELHHQHRQEAEDGGLVGGVEGEGDAVELLAGDGLLEFGRELAGGEGGHGGATGALAQDRAVLDVVRQAQAVHDLVAVALEAPDQVAVAAYDIDPYFEHVDAGDAAPVVGIHLVPAKRDDED